MRILILGGAGMLGRKLYERLERGDCDLSRAQVMLADVGFPPGIAGHVIDLSQPGAVDTLIAERPDVIFHLAAVVSGEAEDDLAKGYRVNLDGTRNLLDAVRAVGGRYRPRIVFTSSIAVFGAPFPDVIDDHQAAMPLTSYGTQKAVAELLLNDYSRRGFLDGVGIRLPTICVRPGAPNRAASGFFSSIIREPLQGREAILPVSTDVRHWFASPRAAVEQLLRAATLDSRLLGERRCLTMPGLSATVAEQIAALRRVAGDGAVVLIRHAPDEAIARIVAGWPRAFDTRRAHELGFAAEQSFDEIVRVHLEDDAA